MKRAFSLAEILVVIAIIVLLIALIFPVLRSAKRSSQIAVATSNLHQIHTAIVLYRDSHDGYPLQNLDELIQSGVLQEPSILHLAADPVAPGFANRLYACNLTKQSVVPKNPTSFEDVFHSGTRPDGSTFQLYLDMLRPHDQNPGLVATRIFGTRYPFDPTSCAGLTTGYDGFVLRVREAGNVQRANYRDVDENGNRRYCWPAIFTDVDPNIICERP